MNEKHDLLKDIKAVYGEIFPHRDPEGILISDATLALGILLRRELRLLRRKVKFINMADPE
jgi:hypothetical protein